MIKCPGCGGDFEKQMLFAHAFHEHPSMPVRDLHDLVDDKSLKIAELESQALALKAQATAVNDEIAKLKG